MRFFIVLALFGLALGHDADECPTDVDNIYECDEGDPEFDKPELPATCAEIASDPNAASICFSYHEAQSKCPCTCAFVKCGEGATPAPGTTDVPDFSFGPNTGGGGGDCFHRDSVAMTSSGPMTMGELKDMQDVEVEAITEDGEVTRSKIVYWLHNDDAKQTEMHRISTEAGQAITASRKHLVYVVPCSGGDRQAVFAQDVKEGECVLVRQDGAFEVSRVVENTKAVTSGLYSPITEEGSIVVNGVAASCYNTFVHEKLQHMFFNTFLSVLPSWAVNVQAPTSMPEFVEAAIDLVGKRIL